MRYIIGSIITCCVLITLPAAASADCTEEASCPYETGGPPGHLNVTVIPVHGSSYRNPGHTAVDVATNKFAEVWIRTAYPGESTPSVVHFKERLESEEDEWGKNESDGATYAWSCAAPRVTVRYEVQVKGEYAGIVEAGPGLTHTGTFIEPLSRTWCQRAKAQEDRERWERKQSFLSCGNIFVDGSEPFMVTARHGGVTCSEARRTLQSFMNGGGEEHGGAESAAYLKTWTLPGGWTCGFGAGAGACNRGHTGILALWDGHPHG